MKLTIYSILICLYGIVNSGLGYAQHNTLSRKEKKDGWELLFNGKNLENWHIYNRGKIEAGWTAVNGEIVFQPSGNPVGGIDLVTDSVYGDFDLQLEWKISEGGNSGVFFCVREGEQYPYESYTGIEMQLLDNRTAADRHDGKHLAGALYDLIDVSETSKPRKCGEWNKSRIRFENGRICFWLNGLKTVDIVKGSSEWNSLVENSKFKDSDFARFDTGHIVLQDHTDEVAFRNIKVKRLE